MRLSICIPTYNRGPFIGELLDSIISQTEYDCDVEVVISDNASTDQTHDVIERYKDKIKNLVYYRAPENMGADRNFLKVVELSTGDFCWLMGSDDKLEPLSIAEIEHKCSDYPQISGISLNRNAYNYDMDAKIYERPVASGVFTGDSLISGAEDIFSKLGEYFGYLSGQVIRRELWNDVVSSNDVAEYFNAYVHIFIIGKMVQRNPFWLYIQKPCVGWRSGNDSFMSEGAFKRMMIDVIGYEKIARDLFGPKSAAYHDINRAVASIHVRYAVMGAKLNGSSGGFFKKSIPILIRQYWRYPAFWTYTAPFLLAPTPVMRAARWGYRRVLKRPA